MIKLTIDVTGPLADPSLVGRVVPSELQAANTDTFALVRPAANRVVNRDLGTYERGWQPPRHQHGAGSTLLTSTMDNTAPNAAPQEDGRKAGTQPPVDAFVAWSIRRGIVPNKGDTPKNRRDMAFAMVMKHKREGWRTANPPAPVDTALAREADAISLVYDRAGARIARRLG